MSVTITARHFKLKDDLKEFVEEKVKKLERYYDGKMDIDIVLGWEKMSRYTEFRLLVNNKNIVIKEESDEMKKSFVMALENAERQLKKYKEKLKAPVKVKEVAV